MRWLDKLERRFGRYAIPNLTVILIAFQVVVYIMSFVDPRVVQWLALQPSKVAEGEVYRLFSFMCTPGARGYGLLAIFYYLLTYLMGTALEAQWGTFRYNVYLLIGYLANVSLVAAWPILDADAVITSEYFGASVFLAFAVLFPDFEIRVMFILPVKVKYLGMLSAASLLIWFASTPFLIVRLMIGAWVLNFIIFFGPMLFDRIRSHQRKMSWHARVNKRQLEPRHTCTTCGVNSDIDPDMDFRYCTKCAGDLCYCADHVRDHEHVVEEKEEETGNAERGTRN